MNFPMFSRLFLILTLATSFGISSLSAMQRGNINILHSLQNFHTNDFLINRLTSLRESVKNGDESKYATATAMATQEINNQAKQVQNSLLMLFTELIRKEERVVYSPAYKLAKTVADELRNRPRNQETLNTLCILVDLFDLLVEKGYKAAYMYRHDFVENVLIELQEILEPVRK